MSSISRIEDILQVIHQNETPDYAIKHRATQGRKGLGLRYEGKVQKHLRREFGDLYIPSPWFKYRLRGEPNRWNFAQPDGIHINFKRGLITIYEMKYSHISDAYFQLVDKYLPLMKSFFGTTDWSYAMCEIVFWYDKSVAFPCDVRMRKDLELIQPNEFAVHICRPLS